MRGTQEVGGIHTSGEAALGTWPHLAAPASPPHLCRVRLSNWSAGVPASHGWPRPTPCRDWQPQLREAGPLLAAALCSREGHGATGLLWLLGLGQFHALGRGVEPARTVQGAEWEGARLTPWGQCVTPRMTSAVCGCQSHVALWWCPLAHWDSTRVQAWPRSCYQPHGLLGMGTRPG